MDSAEDLIGQRNLHFRLYIRSAANLPELLCCNTFVTYQFSYERQSLYTTEEVKGVNRNPQWSYEEVHRIEDLSERVVQELKGGNISFMIYGYPAARAQIREDDISKKAMQRRHTVMPDD